MLARDPRRPRGRPQRRLAPSSFMTVAQRTMGAPSHLLFDVVEALRQVRAREAAGPCTKSIRIKVLRNYSAEFVEPFLKYYFGRIGVGCTVAFGGYDTIHQELLAGDGLRDHDLVLLSLVLEPLQAADEAAAGGAAGDILARVTGMIDLVLERTAAPVVLNTFIRPILDAEGAAGAVRAESASSRVAEINQGLRAHAREKAPRCLLIDFERLLMLVGLEAAIDRRMGYVAGAPFRHGFLSAYAYEVFRIGRALAGAAKKCLILDCDNTLWGGVVGEVGLEGIDLDRNQYPGKAFYDFQKAIVRLAGEGVMVALCSKNNLDDVMEVLDRHPHCLLKRRHLVGYRIDWQDKERNIEALVEELNIGMDAVLFVDDSPVERERIQAFLPDITVRTVPKQLYDLPLLLAREGLFDKLAVTGEDEKRARLYQAEAQRREVAAAFASVDEFLGSLELKARIEPANASRVPRVSQLTQKTNQLT